MKIIDFMCRSLDHTVDFAGAESQNEGKKKKKKKSKTRCGDTSRSTDEPGIAMEEGQAELIEKIEHTDQVHQSKVRTVSNGLVIEELSMGKQEEKIADNGNKVSSFMLIYLLMSGQVDHGLIRSCTPTWSCGRIVVYLTPGITFFSFLLIL